MNCLKAALVVSLFLSLSSLVYSKNVPNRDADSKHSTLININNISMWVHSDGVSSHNPHTDRCGVVYPKGTAGVIYLDGIQWAGYVNDGQQPDLRAGGSYYGTGMVPGRIISKGVAENSDDPDVRIWRVRKDCQTADLKQDASEYLNMDLDSVTQDQIDDLRTMYETDWNNWPWQKGAPFYDINENGLMDAGEEPGFMDADQVVWYVCNDLDEEKTQRLFGSPPI